MKNLTEQKLVQEHNEAVASMENQIIEDRIKETKFEIPQRLGEGVGIYETYEEHERNAYRMSP